MNFLYKIINYLLCNFRINKVEHFSEEEKIEKNELKDSENGNESEVFKNYYKIDQLSLSEEVSNEFTLQKNICLPIEKSNIIKKNWKCLIGNIHPIEQKICHCLNNSL